MRLAAIFNCWADWDWMELSVPKIRPLVDGIIIVASEKSNYGEFCKIPEKWCNDELFIREPVLSYPMHEETERRNYGLEIARSKGYTHFLMMDADEFYDPEDFIRETKRFHVDHSLAGLVCATRVYVKSPTLSAGLDTTLVPFIHKITPGLCHEFNRKYPFAWSGKSIRIDPTRSLNINSGVQWSTIVMDHFSWVRADYDRKIRNSTARPNIEKMGLVKKILHLKEGDIFDLYPGKPLVRVPNKYGLPELNGVLGENLP